ncbi:hypothetical protein SDJN02_06197, partial [Cucurbita argyrosperma subsp. argyrosperma]
MLCNDGLQAFDLAAVAFAAVIDSDSKGNNRVYLLVLFRLFYFTAGSPLLLRLHQWLLGFCILFSPQHLHNLWRFQTKRREGTEKLYHTLSGDEPIGMAKSKSVVWPEKLNTSKTHRFGLRIVILRLR